MDYRITTKQDEKKHGCLISFLIFIIIILLSVAAVYMLSKKTKNSKIEEEMQTALKPKISDVMSGTLRLSANDLTGNVRANQSLDLRWQTNGTVEQINVKIGDTVKQGDILATLDPETVSVEISNATLELKNAEEDLEKLKNNSVEVSKALSAMVTAQRDADKAKTAYDSLNPALASQESINLAHQEYLKKQYEYERAMEKFEDVRFEPADSAIRKKRLGDVGGYRTVRDNALAEYHFHLGQGNEDERIVREAALQFAEADLAEKKYLYEKALKGPSAAKIAEAQGMIEIARKKVDAIKLIAPFDGTITQMDTYVMDVVSLESTANTEKKRAAIRIDDLSSLFIEFNVSELVVNAIQVGQIVNLDFMAIPGKMYHGKVVKIADTGSEKNYSVTFPVTVKLTDADAKVKPGMSAEGSMEITKIENALFVSANDILTENGNYFVNIMQKDGTYKKTQIEIGLISGQNVEIKSGLKAEDKIQTNFSGLENGEEFYNSGYGGFFF